jgi:hypothetical protein
MYARCPQCGQPAEIIDRFALGGSDGPLEHVKLSCSSGRHWYTPLAADVELMDMAPSAEELSARSARRAA